MPELLVIAPPGAVKPDQAATTSGWWLVDANGTQSSGEIVDLADKAGGEPVVLVLSAADVLISRVTLAKKQAKHIARVVPFLLEDQLLVAPEGQWFSWGEGDPQGEYPVAAIDREGLEALLARLRTAGLTLKSLRIDALELASQGPGLASLGGGMTLLMVSPSQALVLPDDQLSAYVGEQAPLGDLGNVFTAEGYRQALQDCASGKPVVELMHGPFRVKKQPRARQARPVDAAWRKFGLFAAVAALCGLLLVAFQGWQYRDAADTLRARANAAYEDMFPGDRATAKLERQFQRRLEMAGGSATGSGFLALIEPVGEALSGLREKGVAPRSIQYSERDGNLVLELSAPDYELLQSLQTRIENQGLVAEIANYRNQGKQVTALLRVQGS